MIRLKRIYEPATREDGERYLVERLWPRGVTRGAARLTAWLKDVAPSPALRRWYGHDPKRWAEFRRRYVAELRAPEKRQLLRCLAEAARRGTVTLIFAARDLEHNSALVLRDCLKRSGTSDGRVRRVGKGKS